MLEGRKALVTGASSGIGKATTLRLGQEGACVCVNYYSDKEAGEADQVVEAVERAGTRAIAVQADVGDEDQVKAMVAQVADAFGGLDLLVNNAGIERQVPLLEMSLEDWEKVLRTNLTGSFLCLREAGKVMAADGGGVVVNMSSVHEFIPWPGFAHYCASKAGIRLLMQTAARELAAKGIRVVTQVWFLPMVHRCPGPDQGRLALALRVQIRDAHGVGGAPHSTSLPAAGGRLWLLNGELHNPALVTAAPHC